MRNGLLLFVVWLLAGCVSLAPNSITLSTSDVERLLARSFPIERRLLDAFDVTVDQPRVRLLPDGDRLAVNLDFGARERLFGGRWHGQIAFDAGLRYDAGDQTVRLRGVHVDSLAFERGGGAEKAMADRVAGELVRLVLDGMVIYRLPPERLQKLRERGMVPAAVAVNNRGVEITFTPSP